MMHTQMMFEKGHESPVALQRREVVFRGKRRSGLRTQGDHNGAVLTWVVVFQRELVCIQHLVELFL